MFVAKIKQVRTMDICSYYLYIHTLVHLIYSCEFEQKLLAGCPPLHEGFVASVHMIVWNRPDDPGTIAQAGESPTHRQAPCEGIPLGRYARPNYYTQLACRDGSFPSWISQLPCLFNYFI